MRNPESASTTRENLHLQADKESVYFWREIDYSERGNKKLKPEFSRIRGGGSMSEISICSIDFDKSSTENGILKSSSNRKELLTALFESSVISTLIFAITSEETLCVPYLSSQYIVLIRYNCCMLRTGHRS